MDETKDIKQQDDEISSKQGNVLIVDAKTTEESIEDDERFFADEKEKNKDIDDTPDKPVEKVFDKKLKKKMRQEQKLVDKEIFKKKLVGIFKMEGEFMPSVVKVMDFTLNMFSIGIIIVAVIVTLNFLMNNNPIMTVVGCLFIWLTIYLNKQIS